MDEVARSLVWQAVSMRALVQRVLRAEVTSRASVEADWAVVGSIGAGLCVFLGATHDDSTSTADKMAQKIWDLRIFSDADGMMNVALSKQPTPAALVVSQFTLYGNTVKGRRPSWVDAARPEVAEPLVDRVAVQLAELGATVETGRFQTDMCVDLVNDGPVTLMLELP
jgi:D-tyrosyl-tRNA(Tyr) deacylase